MTITRSVLFASILAAAAFGCRNANSDGTPAGVTSNKPVETTTTTSTTNTAATPTTATTATTTNDPWANPTPPSTTDTTTTHTSSTTTTTTGSNAGTLDQRGGALNGNSTGDRTVQP